MVSDFELKKIVLQNFFENRKEEVYTPLIKNLQILEDVTQSDIFRICGYLAENNLITWTPLTGGSLGVINGVGKITNQGLLAIERNKEKSKTNICKMSRKKPNKLNGDASVENANTKNHKKTQNNESLSNLLDLYDKLAHPEYNSQQRGLDLEKLLPKIFNYFHIPMRISFKRNNEGEQIDGAFELDGWFYLIECKWTKKLNDIRDLDSLLGKIGRSGGKQTMGFFLSINGWSKNVIPVIKTNPEKSIILMDGNDLRCVIDNDLTINLKDFIKGKLAALNLDCNPFLSAQNYLMHSMI